MISKIVAATALAFCVSSAALAASSTTTTTGMPTDWPAAVKDAFFSDAGTKLRSQEEIRTKWASLTDEQKTQVKADCQKTEAAAGTSTETTASTSTESGTESTTGTATTGTTAGGDQMASMSQLCTWVKGM